MYLHTSTLVQLYSFTRINLPGFTCITDTSGCYSLQGFIQRGDALGFPPSMASPPPPTIFTLARGIGSWIVARDGSKCCMYIYLYIYICPSHFGMQLNFYVTSWLRIYELRENLLPDFDRCSKEALVVSKVPWVYTESDDVGKAWERGYVTVGDFRWATNTGSLVRDLNGCHKLPMS